MGGGWDGDVIFFDNCYQDVCNGGEVGSCVPDFQNDLQFFLDFFC